MPSERRGTVLEDFAGYFHRLRGTAEWRGDKNGTIRAPIAKVFLPQKFCMFLLIHFLEDAFPRGRRDKKCAILP